MFFESYTEKLWGRHPRIISADWGAQRVKGLSITTVLLNIIKKIFPKSWKTKIKTETSLIESFMYPKYGPGQLWQNASVRRHLLCPLFATRFVSAFFFRARGGAAARRDGGLKEGGAVYAVSALGLAAAAAFRETFLQDASGSLRTAGASGLRGGWRRRMSTLV